MRISGFWSIAFYSIVLISLTGCAFQGSSAQQGSLWPADWVGQGGNPKANFEWTGAPSEGARSRTSSEVGTRGMVVAADREAANWGAEILRRGGNAIDAAVATALMLAVTRPQFGSLGGGGFLLYCPKPKVQDGKALGPSPCSVLDYREVAPQAAFRDMYLVGGKASTEASQNSALSSGVPGVPAGLMAALEKWGSKNSSRGRAELFSKPIEVAEKGMRFSSNTEVAAYDRWKAFSPEAKRLFGCGQVKQPCPVGSIVKQPELASVLRLIAEKGRDGFYLGSVAKRLAKGHQEAGGILTEKDLAAYQPKLRTPVSADYRGWQVVSMPPPSAGGAIILQMLGYLERVDRAGHLAGGYGAPETLHAVATAMTLGFADRAKLFGDPDFVRVPLSEMLEPSYLDGRWKLFDPQKKVQVPGAGLSTPESIHTTHFSVIDREGNAVAITTTVNDNFGSGFVPPGTGVVMNNEMDDFSIQPGVPNLFGLVGEEANRVEAGKRPLSSMSPTIVRDAQGRARIVVGAAGGPRITTSVFLILLGRLRFGLSIADAISAPRFHTQWKPDVLFVERGGFPLPTLQRLMAQGYTLREITGSARAHALERFPDAGETGRVWGAPDPRGEGAAVAE